MDAGQTTDTPHTGLKPHPEKLNIGALRVTGSGLKLSILCIFIALRNVFCFHSTCFLRRANDDGLVSMSMHANE